MNLLTKNAIFVLIDLAELQAVNPCYAYSINDLLIEGNHAKEFSYSGLYKMLEELVEEGLLEHGLKEGSAFTYYYSNKGFKFYVDNISDEFPTGREE